MIRRHIWARHVALCLAALAVASAGAQPRAYCPSGTQAKWVGAVLRCEKVTVVASAPPVTCDSSYPACLVVANGLTGKLVVVAGGRDHCNHYCTGSGPRSLVLKERYPTCPTGLSMTQDAGPNGQDLCTATAPGWVAPLLAPN